MNSLPPPILLDIAIFFTALSWGIGFYIVDRKAHVFSSLAIGCFVCLLGYSVASVGAPAWAVGPPRSRSILCCSGMFCANRARCYWPTRRSGPSTSSSTSC